MYGSAYRNVEGGRPRTGIVGTRRGGRGAKRSVLAGGEERRQKIRSGAGSRDIYRGEVKAAPHNRASTSTLSPRISFSYPSRLHAVCHILHNGEPRHREQHLLRRASVKILWFYLEKKSVFHFFYFSSVIFFTSFLLRFNKIELVLQLQQCLGEIQKVLIDLRKILVPFSVLPSSLDRNI